MLIQTLKHALGVACCRDKDKDKDKDKDLCIRIEGLGARFRLGWLVGLLLVDP
jgi:hypothetical protein